VNVQPAGLELRANLVKEKHSVMEKCKLATVGVVSIAFGLLSTSAHATMLASPYGINVISGVRINGGATAENNYDSQTDTPLGFTAKSVSSSVTGSGASPDIETALGYAEANLAEGAVRASATGTENGNNYAAAAATAKLYDTLTFNIPGATNSTITQIGISMHVDGISSGTSPDASGSWVSDLIIGGQVKSTCCVFSHQAQSTYEPNPTISNYAVGWDSSSVTYSAVNGADFSGVFSVYGANPQIMVNELLEVEGGGGVVNDFSNTAFLNFNLPSDVTFGSASGIFLSTPLSTVPEPPSIAVFGVALLGVGFMRRRQR
jgi:hypothetical protein